MSTFRGSEETAIAARPDVPTLGWSLLLSYRRRCIFDDRDVWVGLKGEAEVFLIDRQERNDWPTKRLPQENDPVLKNGVENVQDRTNEHSKREEPVEEPDGFFLAIGQDAF